jgi:pimeloyl-ACP methyl ester carboxylesterase
VTTRPRNHRECYEALSDPPPVCDPRQFPEASSNDPSLAMTTLIFVHGACVRDAEWWWAQMTRPLADHGITSIAVPLSSCGESGDELGDLYADVGACRETISAAEGPVVLCGHSYGGMVITEAGAADRVTQLLYVTSVMPDAGQSQAALIGSEPAPWLQPGEDGTVGVDPDMIREFFLQDCDESTTEQALGRLTRQSLTPFTQPPRQIAWKQKPATYFVCTEDLATPAVVQRRRVRDETRLVEFSAGHHPFLSRPDEFAHSIAAAIQPH